MGFFSIFKKKNKGSKSDKSRNSAPKTILIQPAGNESASSQSSRPVKGTQKLITEENFLDDRIDISGEKDPDELSLPGGMREEREAYEAAMKRKAEREAMKALPPEKEIVLEGLPEKQEQAQPQVQPQAQPQAQAQPQIYATQDDLILDGPTVYMGDDTKTIYPKHQSVKKGAKKQNNQARRNRIEEVQEAQNPVAFQGFQPVRPAPRTKFGARQKAGNLAGSAVSSVLTTGVMTAFSPILIPFAGYTEVKASTASKYGQQSRRHDLIPGWEGATYENPDAGGGEILSDVRRVPTVWAKPIAEKAENEDGTPKQPEITVYAKQPNIGSSRSTGPGGAGHTFLGLRYTRRSPRTERNERFELIMGFYPNGEYVDSGGAPMATKNIRIPGKLMDDSTSAYTISRRYPATNAQVNAIVKASETYADKGYNVFERNCTTFVNEMIRDHAHLNTGGKIFEKEEMRFDAKSNVMRGGLSWATPFMDVYTLNKMTNNAGKVDDSYAGYGNMKVTKDEIQQYKKSRNYFNPVKKGYTPAVTAENLRRIPGNNNSILGSFYYYGGLNVEEPEGKGHANASNLKDVTYQEVENQLMTTGNDLQAAILQLLPEEMQYQANEERPQDIQNFLEASAFACEAYGDLIMTSNTRKNKLGEKAASEDVEDYVSFDEIKNAYTRLQKYQADISKGFSQTFQGDTRLESKVMNMLSIISIAFQQINGFYQAKYRKTERQSADLGDIRTEMRRLFKLKSGDDSIDISPTRYEAYLAIYKSPAAVIEAYARLKELKKAQQDETITDDEQKELDRLVDIDGTADEFVTSHDYLLQKDNYTQQDLDYIFKLKAREKRGLEGKNLNTFNKGDSAAGIYQALVMDKIFGGIKAAYLRDYDKQQLNVPKSLEVWLSNYIVEKSWNHAKELEMVIRAIRRVSPRHTKKTLYNYMSTMVSQMYLGKVFPYGSEDNKLAVANLFVQPTMEEIMKKGNSGFPLLVKALIDKIMKEKT